MLPSLAGLTLATDAKTERDSDLEQSHTNPKRQKSPGSGDESEKSESDEDVFYHALLFHDFETLREMLEDGFDINAPLDWKSKTALMYACQEQNKKAIELLIEYNADPNIQDDDGRTALMWVCFSVELDSHWSLIDEGNLHLLLLDIDGIDVHLKDKQGRTALHYACSSGFDEIAKDFLKAGIDVNVQDNNGNTALHNAFEGIGNDAGASVYTARVLLDDKNINVNLINKNGLTVLMVAADGGILELVEKLIERKADVNMEFNGETALRSALRECIDQRDYYSKEWDTAGHINIFGYAKDHPAVVERFLGFRDINLDLQDYRGRTVLHMVAEAGMVDYVKRMKTPENVNMQNKQGETALHLACKNKHAAVALALLDDKHIKLDLKDAKGHTAMHYASGDEMLEVVGRMRGLNI